MQLWELFVLAVKPVYVKDALRACCKGLAGKAVVSIVAGLSGAALAKQLPEGTRCLQTMPNTPAMVNEGTFRADLLDRLAFDVVQLPPLRERESDIMLMAEHFAIQMCREIKLPLFPGFTEHARETLLNYRWPGNIRELKNVVERSVYRHGTSDYPLDDIIIDPFKRRPPEDAIAVSETTSLPTLPLDLREFQMQQEKELLQLSLQQGKYNQKRAAELLGLTYHQFRALLKKHQI